MYKPFIKVTWDDSPENFTPEKIKRVKAYFEKKYKTKSVRVITNPIINVNNTELKSLDFSQNIVDHNYQKKLMKDFITENNMTVNEVLLEKLDNRVNGVVLEQNINKIKHNKWFIREIEFDNFLSFGIGNKIIFDNLDGITVVESIPKNFGGKTTSTVDLLLFLFFGRTTKTKTNIEIFNRFNDENEVSVKGKLTIDGEDYVIHRKINRKRSKKNDFTVTNSLDFFKITEKGIENLEGEKRQETEKFIESAIGTEEDFLSTILTTGYNLEELIESKPTARGQILTKFLGLENLKQKEDICKDIFNDWNKKLVSNSYNITSLNTENDNFNDQIKNSEITINSLNETLKIRTEELKDFEKQKEELLSKRNNDIDIELLKTNPDQLRNEIRECQENITNKKNTLATVNVTEPSKYYDEEEHEKVISKSHKIILEGKTIKNEIESKQNFIEELKNGTICPTCKQPLKDVDHTNEILETESKIIILEEKRKKLQEEYNQTEIISKGLQELKKEFDLYEKNKLIKEKLELEIEKNQHQILINETKIERYDSNNNKLLENKKIDADLIIIKTKIETANADVNKTNIDIEKYKNNIENLKNRIITNNELISKIKKEDELMSVFKTYLTVYGKNGISKVILKNMIPIINQELFKLLMDSCYFILELNINDKNEVEFVMIDSETRVIKPLNSGSGYERTISSLALRSVLTKISSLPKPNIVVMDEVFGKSADETLELVGEFFKKIKDYFEKIIIISHNNLIRNWSDNLVMIRKDDNISRIDQMKIS